MNSGNGTEPFSSVNSLQIALIYNKIPRLETYFTCKETCIVRENNLDALHFLQIRELLHSY